MKNEGKNRQPNGSLPKVGTARRAVRLFVGRASRLPSTKMRPKAGGTSPIAGGTPALQWSRGARPPSGVPPRAPRGGLETNVAGRPVELFVKSGAGAPKKGAQAARLCMAESEATSSTGLAPHRSTRPRRPCPILKQQGRLQPMRFATPAWQAAVKNGTPATRHPYQLFSKGAAALLAPSTSIALFPFTLTPSIPTFLEVMS